MEQHAAGEGWLLTRELVLDGAELQVNCRADGELRVELAEYPGQALPGYALADCDPITGDHVRPHRHLGRQPRPGTAAGPAGLYSLSPARGRHLGVPRRVAHEEDDMRSPNEMRIGLGQFRELTDEKLAFIKQLGADDFLMNTPDLPGTARWELADLVALRERADAAELRLMCLENVPVSFYDKAMLGLPGRDEQIEHMQATIRNMGRAGIPILGYHWMPNQVWRSPERERLRGGALATRFDMAEHGDAPLTHGRVFDEDEMWANYEYYLRAILPVAEEAGVTLALHPDDPPVPSLGGVARIFRNFAGFKRAIDTFDSPNHGLDFCMGCWSEMGPSGVSGANRTPGVLDAVRHFGGRDRIVYVHFRDVQGEVPCFNECFIDDGNQDTFAVVQALHEVGFTGFMITDHVPAMVDDTTWGHRGRAYAIGYIRALIDVARRAA